MATADNVAMGVPRKRVFTPDQFERRKATAAAYHAKNREKRNARCRVYSKAHPKPPRTTAQKLRRNKTQRAHYAAHPEKRRVYNDEQKQRAKTQMAAYCAANREELKEKARSRIAANPEKKKASDDRWRAQNKERAAASRRAWQAANAEKVNAARKKWHKEHPGAQSAYRAAHRDEAIARSRAWRNANPERQKANTKKWAANNPHKIRAYQVRRKLAVRGATIGDISVIAEWEKRWKRSRTIICYWCRAEVPTKGCHTDHIVPIAKDGPHSASNLCVACGPCNKSKNAKTIEVWNRQIAEPVLL